MKLTSRTIGLVIILALPMILVAQSNVVVAPLPPISLVIQRTMVEARRESDREHAFKQNYSYTRTRVTEYRDADGDLKSREEKVNNNRPHAVTAQQAQTVSRPANAQSAGVTLDGDNVHGKAFNKNDFLSNPDLLNRFQFTLAGRETVNGRPALIVDFQPKSGDLPEQSIKDRVIDHAAGRVWVDEQDYALVKADLHLTHKINVFGGLIGAVWKGTFSFERMRTDDGFWFVRNASWHLEGRAVVVRRTVDYHEQWTNVRKTT